MSTGQTVLTILAFVLMSSIIVNFYQWIGLSGDTIVESQDRIVATSIGSSYIEFAQGLAFDRVTANSDSARGHPSVLTAPSLLAQDSEDSANVMNSFDDFDDFNGLEFEQDAGGTNGRYRTRFSVYYVDPGNIDVPSSVQTFVKRMDLKIWRADVINGGASRDTVTMFTTSGYFKFN
jgi:hypothetical protein